MYVICLAHFLAHIKYSTNYSSVCCFSETWCNLRLYYQRTAFRIQEGDGARTHTHFHTLCSPHSCDVTLKGKQQPGMPCAKRLERRLASISQEHQYKELGMLSPETERSLIGHRPLCKFLSLEWIVEHSINYHMLSTCRIRLNAFYCWDRYYHYFCLTETEACGQ